MKPLVPRSMAGGSFAADMPIVFVAPRPLALIHHAVDHAPLEVALALSVSERDDGSLLVEDAFFFEQEVTAGEWRTRGAGLAGLMSRLARDRPDDSARVCQLLRGLAHSHVDFGTDISETDLEQMQAQFGPTQPRWTLSAIANKKGSLRFWLHFFGPGQSMVTHEVQWAPLDPEAELDQSLRGEIERDYAEFVTECNTFEPEVAQ